ncbi:MAG: hypothetical protein J6D38_05845 [Solobacterium sp.]|nr:hypothetical protein [Solobacterium sp.]
MVPTYTRRSRTEFNLVLRNIKEEDLLRKAEMLSASSDPDSIFQHHTIRKNAPFGVLVIFSDWRDQEREMPEAARCDTLDEIENMLNVLQAYPKMGVDYFEEKRQAYLKEVQRMHKLQNTTGSSDKERHRLENAVRNADMQRAWLEKENTDRLNKIKLIEEEIRKYEEELATLDLTRTDNSEKIQMAVERTGPIKQEIEQNTQRLKELTERLDGLHAEQALTDKNVSPTTARLQELEEQRLTDEHNSLEIRIEASAEKLRHLEEAIEQLRAADTGERETELTASLNRSKLNLKQAQNELAGGQKRVDNLDLRVQILGGRLKALQDSETLPEARQNSRIAVLARAEELLNAWISTSRVLQKILQVDGVSAKELVEALFFANGPMCACGVDACGYLDGTDATMAALLLYGTEDEHVGFQRVEVFY